MTRIDNGDGTWSTPRISTEDEVVEGALTWRYRWQSRIAMYPTCETERRFVHYEDPPLPLSEQLLGAVRHDANGEDWEVVAVDAFMLDPELVGSVDRQIADWVPLSAEEEGTEVVWIPTSWATEDCDNSGGNDTFVFEDESREPKTSEFTGRQTAAVRVSSAGAVCSGTLIRPLWVLTAAHCVEHQDDSLHADFEGGFTITNVYGQTRTSDLGHRPGTYNNTSVDSDYDNDWALLRITSAFTAVPEEMNLFGGEDSAYKDIDDAIHANDFPHFRLDSSGNCVTPGGTVLHVQTNAHVTSTAYNRIKLKSDTSQGASGGSYFFCPTDADDWCGEEEHGDIVGVQSGYNPVEDRNIGPKATAFRPAAITFIDNH